MISTLSFSIILTALLMLLTATSPLTLGCSILIMTLAFCCLASIFTLSWFTLILFLIYVGGLLIMFAYFVALSPNQHHQFLISPPLLFMVFLVTSAMSPFYMPLFMNTPLFYSMTQLMPSLYTHENFLSLMFAAITLFITLLAVVKTVSLPFGPLRPFSHHE
uniref:NADH dehydrogenase subunit 6 n=1 Tax=Cirriformia cf. tentaculata HK-2018 TaxID=2100094 RepID=A0A343UWF8_9ANNE|nr:NADH dehydrogenase subunit 6 [Cirriformia cf. tentaculata HK-2018]AVI26186.1 NADH dehydrogenase subunit 6 [Cirriformia cf. tentaculata HK-2018]